jgi:hypothetical protein
MESTTVDEYIPKGYLNSMVSNYQDKTLADIIDAHNKVVNEPCEGDTNQAHPVAPEDKAVRGLHILHATRFIECRLGHT